ncbi:hypothetical protein GCM10009682_26660 [Luedemannella flava]|uniref:Uncharacterized protein n=1 Tax=Luedemannella flava TaxID=349316 RepID=A0ABP4Y898_9ACTN
MTSSGPADPSPAYPPPPPPTWWPQQPPPTRWPAAPPPGRPPRRTVLWIVGGVVAVLLLAICAVGAVGVLWWLRAGNPASTATPAPTETFAPVNVAVNGLGTYDCVAVDRLDGATVGEVHAHEVECTDEDARYQVLGVITDVSRDRALNTATCTFTDSLGGIWTSTDGRTGTMLCLGDIFWSG